MTSSDPGPSGASATQEPHTPHGLAVGPCSQLSERARIRADDVLPQPRGPLNRYAWLIRPPSTAFTSGPVTCSCPTTSAKVAGRYLRYSARATSRGYVEGGTSRHRPRRASPCEGAGPGGFPTGPHAAGERHVVAVR